MPVLALSRALLYGRVYIRLIRLIISLTKGLHITPIVPMNTKRASIRLNVFVVSKLSMFDPFVSAALMLTYVYSKACAIIPICAYLKKYLFYAYILGT